MQKRRTVKTCRKRREFQPEGEKQPVEEEEICKLQRGRLATCRRIGEPQPAEEEEIRNLKMKIRATSFRRRGDFQPEEEKGPVEEEYIRNRKKKRKVATCRGKGDSQHVEGEEPRNLQKKWRFATCGKG